MISFFLIVNITPGFSLEKAMIEGLSKYTNWLEGYANACDHEYSKREI